LNELAKSRGLELIVVGIDNAALSASASSMLDNPQFGKARASSTRRSSSRCSSLDRSALTARDRMPAHRIMGSSLAASSKFAISRYPQVFGKPDLLAAYWLAPRFRDTSAATRRRSGSILCGRSET